MRNRLQVEVDRLGGVVTTAELRGLGYGRGWVDVEVMYGGLIRVRKALWALPDVPREVIAALRLGGRLACASALIFHGRDIPNPERMHIEVLQVTSGTRAKAARAAGAVLHWTRYPVGHRLAVPPDIAWEQYDRCAHLQPAAR